MAAPSRRGDEGGSEQARAAARTYFGPVSRRRGGARDGEVRSGTTRRSGASLAVARTVRLPRGTAASPFASRPSQTTQVRGAVVGCHADPCSFLDAACVGGGAARRSCARRRRRDRRRVRALRQIGYEAANGARTSSRRTSRAPHCRQGSRRGAIGGADVWRASAMTRTIAMPIARDLGGALSRSVRGLRGDRPRAAAACGAAWCSSHARAARSCRRRRCVARRGSPHCPAS